MFKDSEVNLGLYLTLYYCPLDDCPVLLEGASSRRHPFMKYCLSCPTLFREEGSLNPFQIQRN